MLRSSGIRAFVLDVSGTEGSRLPAVYLSYSLFYGRNERIQKRDCHSANNSLMESGDFLSSRAVSSQVLSAFGVLTSVFGMGTGGTLQLLSPEIVFRFQVRGLALLSSRFPSFPPFRVPSLRAPRFRILKTAQDLTWLPQAQSFLSDPSVLSGLPTFLPLSDPLSKIKPSTY